MTFISRADSSRNAWICTSWLEHNLHAIAIRNWFEGWRVQFLDCWICRMNTLIHFLEITYGSVPTITCISPVQSFVNFHRGKEKSHLDWKHGWFRGLATNSQRLLPPCEIHPHCIVAMQDSVPVSAPWYLHSLLPAQKKVQGIFHLWLLSILKGDSFMKVGYL